MQLLLLLIVAGGGEARGAVADSVRMSLLTCSPHEEIYSLYGHSALRVQNALTGQDLVVNYGVFNFHKPHFVLRFVFGLTDYEMGVTPMTNFLYEYSYYHSGVTEQEINLSGAEKEAILRALDENALPENVVYRYNYFYDNCTTRARDMLTNHLQGKVVYASPADSTLTYRDMVHQCTAGHLWMQTGIDLLLGIGADRVLTAHEQQFLPAFLMRDFSQAQIVGTDGSVRPLVARTTTLLEPGEQVRGKEFPLSPLATFGLFFVLTVAITVTEFFSRKVLYLYDLLLMLLTGLAGILIFSMIFSQHPTVRVNLHLLLLNPLPLFFLYPAIRRERDRQSHCWWNLSAALAVLYIIGGFFQCYPPSMYFLASSLLLRNITRRWLLRRSSAAEGRKK